MKPEDFKKVRFFSQAEIERTGAKIEDVQAPLIFGIDRVRKEVNRRIKPLKNGITTGKHSSREHPEGKAIDFTFDHRDGPVTQDDLYILQTCGVNAGFRGFGFYFNGKVWSFHMDLRATMNAWTGRKKAPGAGGWVYKRMSIGFPRH